MFRPAIPPLTLTRFPAFLIARLFSNAASAAAASTALATSTAVAIQVQNPSISLTPVAPAVLSYFLSHSPTLSNSHSLLRSFRSQRDRTSGLSLYHYMQFNGIPRNLQFFNELLDLIRIKPGGRKHSALSLQLFDQLLRDGISPDVTIFNSLIRNLAQFGDLPAAIKILKTMKTAKIKPNSATIMAIISSVGHHSSRSLFSSSSLVDLIRTGWLDLLKMGFIPSIADYTSMISACGHLREAELAISLFNEWKQNSAGDPGDFILYQSIIFACSQRSDYYTQAFDYYEMAISTLQIHNNNININNNNNSISNSNDNGLSGLFQTLLQGASRFGDVANSVLLMKQMKSLGINRNITHFNLILNSIAISQRSMKITMGTKQLSQLDRIEMGKKLMEQIKLSKIQPNRETLEYYINITARALFINRAAVLFDEIHKEFSLKPTYQCWMNMIRMYSRTKRFPQAKKIFERMKSENIIPTKELYRILLVLARQCKLENEGKLLLKEIRDKGIEVDPINSAPFEEDNGKDELIIPDENKNESRLLALMKPGKYSKKNNHIQSLKYKGGKNSYSSSLNTISKYKNKKIRYIQ